MTHGERMTERLISQFWEKPVIAALLEAIGEELDELTKAFEDLRLKRWIDTGEGAQLDGIGDIVGRDRTISNAIALPFFGFSGQPGALAFEEGPFRDIWEDTEESTILEDAQYRLVLWAKVFKNTATCTCENTIQGLKYVFGAPVATVEDAGNAKVRLGIGRRLSPADLMLIKAYSLFIRAGGVGIKYAIQYDADACFGFAGQPGAKPFEEGSFADLIDLG